MSGGNQSCKRSVFFYGGNTERKKWQCCKSYCKNKNVTTSIVSYEEAYCPLFSFFFFLSFSTSCSFLLWKSAKTECLVLSCSSESSATLWSSGGHCVLVAPCHVWAIFTLWFTFRKDNHVGNICRQLLDYTICSTSNPIFFFIYFVNIIWWKTKKLL